MEYLFEYTEDDISKYVVACFNRSRQFKLPILGNVKDVYGLKDGKLFIRDKKEGDIYCNKKIDTFFMELQKLSFIENEDK